MMNTVDKIQIIVIRKINLSKYNDQTEPIFKKLKLSKHEDMLKLMPLSHWEGTELRPCGGKNIAKVATKCKKIYGMGDCNKTT